MTDALRNLLQPIVRGELLAHPIYGGWRIKRVGPYFIDVLAMAFNWRLVTTPVDYPEGYGRYWCYAGTGPEAFTTAILAAAAWDGADDTEPLAWNKNGQTCEWRAPKLDGKEQS